MSMAGCRPLDQGLTRGGKQDEPQPGKQIPTRGRHGRPSSNPCPWEVQDAVSTLSAVQEVAVVGIPDERWGETVKAVIGALIIVFALLELSSRFQALAFPRSWLSLGGALSGFFGGLSGNQGALRSAFLLKAGLSKEAFVATGVVSAVIVDAVRLLVYGSGFLVQHLSASRELVAPVVVGTLCAFAGAVIGKRMLKKVTLRTVQLVVAVAMLVIGVALIAGWV